MRNKKGKTAFGFRGRTEKITEIRKEKVEGENDHNKQHDHK